jgi:UDP-2,3-diacylglucosamine hydrolase
MGHAHLMATTPNHTRQSRKIYFFSDAHLGIGTQETDYQKEIRIVSFLETVLKDGKELFIVGDLFDYWFEYRSVVPRGYVRLLGKLAALTDAGVNISYLTGNHDFWMKGYLQEELGIRIQSEPIERIFAGKRFYICHGDGVDPTDRGYRFLKRVFRNRLNIWMFSLLHPDLATWLARRSSSTSRKHTGQKTREDRYLLEFASRKIDEGYDVVIMGHSHAPALELVNGGTYINLGDWIRHDTYAVFDGRSVTLREWGVSARSRRPSKKSQKQRN